MPLPRDRGPHAPLGVRGNQETAGACCSRDPAAGTCRELDSRGISHFRLHTARGQHPWLRCGCRLCYTHFLQGESGLWRGSLNFWAHLQSRHVPTRRHLQVPCELAETCRCDAREAVSGCSRICRGKSEAPARPRGRADLPAWLMGKGGPLHPREDGHRAAICNSTLCRWAVGTRGGFRVSANSQGALLFRPRGVARKAHICPFLKQNSL